MESQTLTALNDAFRRSFSGGPVILTAGVAALGDIERCALLDKVQRFDAFTPDNDPHGEHDFGAIDHADARYFWKIDYYDLALQCASPDPRDTSITKRVMTIMRADEY